MKKFKKLRRGSILALVLVLILNHTVALASVGEPTKTVSTYLQLYTALEKAKDGDVIGITGVITVPSPDNLDYGKCVTLKRMDEWAKIIITDSYGYGGTAKLKGYTFEGNSTGVGGRAPFLYVDCDVDFSMCEFNDFLNQGESGGVVYVNSGNVLFSSCRFEGNTAESGGAIFNKGSVTLDNCYFVGNWAEDRGGAVYNSGNLTIENTEIKENTGRIGGGIYSWKNVEVNNSIIWANTASQGADIASEGTYTNNTTEEEYNAYLAYYSLFYSGWETHLDPMIGGAGEFLRFVTTSEDPNAPDPEEPPVDPEDPDSGDTGDTGDEGGDTGDSGNTGGDSGDEGGGVVDPPEGGDDNNPTDHPQDPTDPPSDPDNGDNEDEGGNSSQEPDNGDTGDNNPPEATPSNPDNGGGSGGNTDNSNTDNSNTDNSNNSSTDNSNNSTTDNSNTDNSNNSNTDNSSTDNSQSNTSNTDNHSSSTVNTTDNHSSTVNNTDNSSSRSESSRTENSNNSSTTNNTTNNYYQSPEQGAGANRSTGSNQPVNVNITVPQAEKATESPTAQSVAQNIHIEAEGVNVIYEYTENGVSISIAPYTPQSPTEELKVGEPINVSTPEISQPVEENKSPVRWVDYVILILLVLLLASEIRDKIACKKRS